MVETDVCVHCRHFCLEPLRMRPIIYYSVEVIVDTCNLISNWQNPSLFFRVLGSVLTMSLWQTFRNETKNVRLYNLWYQ